MSKSAHVPLAFHSVGPPTLGWCGAKATSFRRLQRYSYHSDVAAISYVRSVDIDHSFGVPNVTYTITLRRKGEAGVAKHGSVRREPGNIPAGIL